MRAGVGRFRVAGDRIGIRCRLDDRQHPANLCQASSPAAIGQKAVVTNPHQSLGQDVEQKAAYELLTIEDELFVSVAVILVARGYLVVVHGENAAADRGA